MIQTEELYKEFCELTFDKDGVLSHFTPKVPKDFNFAYDVIDRIAEIEPNRRAMIWCNDEGAERIFTYKEVRDYSNKAANLFVKYGINHGDMVMLVLKRHYQFWFAILALHKIGAVAIPATNLLTKEDYIYRFDAANIEYIIATSDNNVLDTIGQARKEYTNIKEAFVVGNQQSNWHDFNTLLEKESSSFSRRETSEDDTLLLYFTSGTTGYPKMVTHVHSYPVAHIVTAKFWHNVKSDGLHLTVSETGWAKSVWGKLYGQWFLGAAIFVYDFDRFDPKKMMDRIAKYKVTSFCAPPTIYRFFIKEGMENYDFSSIEYATTAGEALNSEVYNQFYEKTGLRLMEGFGQTETTLLTLNLVGTIPTAGSMGKPSPLYNVDLVDNNCNPVATGEVGEIVVKVPMDNNVVGIFKEYYKNPELTNVTRCSGLYHTGDTAWRDENGLFWYVGRTDDIIKASGYRIGPFEIESVLMEHDAVLECAVTGVPDDIRGTIVKATVVLTSKFSPSEALVKELQEYVKGKTAPYKYPRMIEFVTELPKTISGKIRRAEIRKQDEV